MKSINQMNFYKVTFEYEGKKIARMVDAINLLDVFTKIRENYLDSQIIRVIEYSIIGYSQGKQIVKAGNVLYGEELPHDSRLQPIDGYMLTLLQQQGVIPK